MATDILHDFRAEALARFREAWQRIEHCLAQLSDAQVWWRPAPELNSIGNLMLHLSGNVRQRILSTIGGATDTRDRASEFTERSPIPNAELQRHLRDTVTEADEILGALSADQWADVRRYRAMGRDVSGTVLAVALRTLTHFHGHAQEIVMLTRMQLGDKYQFLLKE